MKKIVFVVIAMLIMLTPAFALNYPWEKDKGSEGKKEVPEDSSKQDSSPSGESSKPSRVKYMTVTGEITTTDMTSKTIIVSGKRGDITLQVGYIKDMEGLKVGDKVKVVYTDSDMIKRIVRLDKITKRALESE